MVRILQQDRQSLRHGNKRDGKPSWAIRWCMPMVVLLAFLMAGMSWYNKDATLALGEYYHLLLNDENLGTNTNRMVVSVQQQCAKNPYLQPAFFAEPLSETTSRIQAWLHGGGNLTAHSFAAQLQEAESNQSLRQHTRERFKFFDALHTPCTPEATTCIGGPCADDETKIACGLNHLQQQSTTNNPCIIYSIGGNNQWNFELDALEKTPCEIHTFDCTGDVGRFQKPNDDRLHFHHICLGTVHEPKVEPCGGNKCGETWTLLEIQQRLGHERIDLFKMDIEGFEWSILDSWPELDSPEADKVLLPHQLLIEFHYWTQFPELRPPGTRVQYDFKTPVDFVQMTAHLARMGYTMVHKKDGRVKHCAELSLMRVTCPSTGVYHHAD